mmetsp:Transcript_10222/g.28152  ORF Transcript_10222/g.28152 Transcript_10222/m.28152 type:complete len:564 (+) Transcript_10222:54-1745(+)
MSSLTGRVVLRGTGLAAAGLTVATVMRYRSVLQRQDELPSHLLDVFEHDRNSHRRTNTGQQQPPQRVLILGAGVVGVSTAYKLAQRGHQVVVLEPSTAPGEECSACAAGGMSRQNVVVDKNTWIAVLQCLTPRTIRPLIWGTRMGKKGNDDDFEFFNIDWFASLSDPFFVRWAWTFTQTSFLPPPGQTQQRQEMLKFTDFAVQDIVNLFQTKWDNMDKRAGYNPRGSLAVSYEPLPAKKGETTPKKSKTGNETNDSKFLGNTLEPNRNIATTEEVLKLEPSLRFQARPPVSAKFEHEAKAASSGRFTKELAQRCLTDPKLNVQFWYETKVQGMETARMENDKHRITKLRTNRGVVAVPDDVHVVVCAGAWTPHVMAMMNLYSPVYPLKGYALSVSAKQALRDNPQLRPCDLPSRIVCDKYMYTTRLGDEIRITSIGEFSEWNTQPTPHVDANFRKQAIRQFPQLEHLIQKAKTYCGHRPYVSDGILLLGAVESHDKLYVSCGPGSNGWKLALGSGEVVARLVSGQSTSKIQEELGFDVSTFSPTGRVLPAPLFAKLCRARWNV